MYYLKLLLVVVAASIGIWHGVNKLVLSTNHMAESFTVSNYSGPEPTNALDQIGLMALDADELQLADEQADLVPQIDEEIAIDTEQAELGAEELAQLIESELNEEELIDNDVVEDILEIKAEKNNTTDQNDMSAVSENVRADSDADMKADRVNTVEPISPVKTGQSKALELDKKLLTTIKPDDLIKEIVKPKATTVRAVDLAYAAPADSNCVSPDGNYPRVGIHYRPDSFAIKGQSLTKIDKLLALYKKCAGKLFVLDNKIDTDKSDKRLIQLRQDEVKYYLLQRRVPKADMVFPDKS